MQLETLTINMMQRTLGHLTSSGYESIKFDKDGFGPATLKYVEDMCNKDGYELFHAETNGNFRIYYMIKK